MYPRGYMCHKLGTPALVSQMYIWSKHYQTGTELMDDKLVAILPAENSKLHRLCAVLKIGNAKEAKDFSWLTCQHYQHIDIVWHATRRYSTKRVVANNRMVDLGARVGSLNFRCAWVSSVFAGQPNYDKFTNWASSSHNLQPRDFLKLKAHIFDRNWHVLVLFCGEQDKQHDLKGFLKSNSI